MIPSYIPIKQGFDTKGNLVVVYQPVFDVEQVDFISTFYGRKLDSEHFRLAELVGLPKQKMMLRSTSNSPQDEEDDDSE
jgi:hypothetical protein